LFEREGKASCKRCLLLIIALWRAAVRSLADLRKPSSTIPGSVNEWRSLDTAGWRRRRRSIRKPGQMSEQSQPMAERLTFPFVSLRGVFLGPETRRTG